jgi:hypothetical protein
MGLLLLLLLYLLTSRFARGTCLSTPPFSLTRRAFMVSRYLLPLLPPPPSPRLLVPISLGLSLCLSVYLFSVSMYVYLTTSLSCRSVRLGPLCLSQPCFSICLFVCPSFRLFLSLPLCMCSVYLSVLLLIVTLFVFDCLSIYFSILS